MPGVTIWAVSCLLGLVVLWYMLTLSEPSQPVREAPVTSQAHCERSRVLPDTKICDKYVWHYQDGHWEFMGSNTAPHRDGGLAIR